MNRSKPNLPGRNYVRNRKGTRGVFVCLCVASPFDLRTDQLNHMILCYFMPIVKIGFFYCLLFTKQYKLVPAIGVALAMRYILSGIYLRSQWPGKGR